VPNTSEIWSKCAFLKTSSEPLNYSLRLLQYLWVQQNPPKGIVYTSTGNVSKNAHVLTKLGVSRKRRIGFSIKVKMKWSGVYVPHLPALDANLKKISG